MREVADRARIEAFLDALARAATQETNVFVVGGTSAVLAGWRETTVDVDLVMRPESDAMLRAIPELKERFRINVELASPDQFIPVPQGWEDRSPVIRRIGRVTVRHYDLCAQALAKLERGHARDVADVRAMLARGLVSRAGCSRRSSRSSIGIPRSTRRRSAAPWRRSHRPERFAATSRCFPVQERRAQFRQVLRS